MRKAGSHRSRTDTAETRAGRIVRGRRRQDSAATLSCAVTLRWRIKMIYPNHSISNSKPLTATGDELSLIHI